MDRIEFYQHDLGDAEIQSITETLRSLFLTLGPRWRSSSALSAPTWGKST
jgi:hypothetical protein